MSDLPSGWEWSTVGAVAHVGPKWSAEPAAEQKLSFVPMPAVEAESGRLDPSTTTTWIDVRAKSLTRFSEGDLLFAKITPCMENGKIALAEGLAGGMGVGSTEFHVLRACEGIEPRYLLHFLLQRRFRAEAERNMAGAVGQRRVPRPWLEAAPVPVPPSNEQRRIVEALDDHLSRLDAAEGGLRDATLRLAQARISAVQAAVDGAGGAETPLARLAWDAGYGTSTKCSYEGAGAAVARIPNVAAGRIDLSDLKYAVEDLDLSGYQIKAHDLLVVRTNGSRDLIGRCAAAEEDLPAAFASYIIRFRIDPELVNPQWVSVVLGSRSLRRRIESMAASSAGQYNLNIKNLGALPIPVPSPDVQSSTLARLEEVKQGFGRLSQQLVATKQHASVLRRSLLEAAFSGRLVPQDSGDEQAGVLLERIAADRAVRPTSRRRRTAKEAV